jgi:acylphosphatase
MIGACLVVLLFCSPAQDAPAVVRGAVSLTGDVPARRTFDPPTGREKAAHPEGIFIDPVAVDGEKHVQFALVHVTAGLEGRTFPVPREPRSLEVENFELKPRVIGIMAGQELVVTNRDDLLHAVHSLPRSPGNQEFNTGLPRKGMSFKAIFAKAEVAVQVKTECLHDWERAWVAVLPHPFYAVTDAQGRYEIRGLPPGRYTLEAWQENCEPTSQEVDVKAGEIKAIGFALEARTRAHLWLSGRVQGVGFRASTQEEAKRIGGVAGWVMNLSDGRVEAIIEGRRDRVEALVRWCRKGPSSADVTKVERKDEPPGGEVKTFEVRY